MRSEELLDGVVVVGYSVRPLNEPQSEQSRLMVALHRKEDIVGLRENQGSDIVG